MPWFIPAIAVGATMALTRKIVARYWHAQTAHLAAADPPGLRTVVRFTGDPQDAMLAVAAELARDLDAPIEVTRDAIRALTGGHPVPVEIVRLGSQPGACSTFELTRAWTGVHLGEETRLVLRRIDDALRSFGATDILWFGRHDRSFVDAHARPYDEQAVTQAR
ncbi:MAG: hypothetical protein M3680_22460 [Myxococcota bacterium]|nr:hypothetical protein [Myxococcota bacterium]